MAYFKQEIVMDKFEKLKEQAETLKDKIYLDGVLAVIENIPTADVEEVKHGEWKKPQFSGRRGFYSVKDFVCNKCGGAFGIEQGNLLMNYCPNCGAKMDGRSDT